MKESVPMFLDLSGMCRADSYSPNVEFCGYSAPHPSEAKIHLRIQMYGKYPSCFYHLCIAESIENLSAVDCLKSALSNLRDLFTSIGKQYSTSLR